MGTAEIRKSARLRESECIHEPCVGSHACRAVRVVWRTEHPIRRARGATGDTVARPSPRPSHGVADRNVDRARIERKRPVRRHCYIDSHVRSGWHAVHRWPPVLIDNPHRWRAVYVDPGVLPARFSPHQKSGRNYDCHANH